LQASVLKSCPEHAAAVADWQHMKALTTRVSVGVYNLIAKYMEELLTPCWARRCDGGRALCRRSPVRSLEQGPRTS
jgi:hypothetical protein